MESFAFSEKLAMIVCSIYLTHLTHITNQLDAMIPSRIFSE